MIKEEPVWFKDYSDTNSPVRNIYSYFIYNFQDLEIIQMSINMLLDKQNMVCSYKGIWNDSKKNKLQTHTPNNMMNIKERYVELKKPDKKTIYINDYSYMEF